MACQKLCEEQSEAQQRIVTSLERKGYSLKDDQNLQNINIIFRVSGVKKGASQGQVGFRNLREAKVEAYQLGLLPR